MDRYTANRYIWLKDQIAAGGSVPQELLDEVAALDATVNGDETSEPPVVGLVDVVGDLEETVEDLDIDINGDDTTEPPTPGLKDRITAIESALTDGVTVASVTADGVKTYSALLDELYSASDAMSDTDILYSRLILGENYFMSKSRNRYGSAQCDSSGAVVSYGIAIRDSGSFYKYVTFSGASVATTDNSSFVPNAGTVVKIVKL